MSDEIRVTDPKTGGQKGSKAERYDQIPPDFLGFAIFAGCTAVPSTLTSAVEHLAGYLRTRDVDNLKCAARALQGHLWGLDIHAGDALARVYGMGAKKYAAFNWLKGYSWSLSWASLCRHISWAARGTATDDESGEHHIAHAIWHCITLHTFATRGLGTDDLYVEPTKAS